jgi:hypothetical protein
VLESGHKKVASTRERMGWVCRGPELPRIQRTDGSDGNDPEHTNSKKRSNTEQHGLITWTYGVGLEGWKERGDLNPLQAVVVGESFPWWAMAVASVGIKVSRVWLTHYPSVGVASLGKTWFGSAHVTTGPDPSKEFLKSLSDCDIVLVGGRVPRVLEAHGIWSGWRLKIVISTALSNKVPPPPWIVDRSHVIHHQVGGVTNGRHLMVVHRRPGFLGSLKDQTSVQPPQDLRWILKSGVPGRLSAFPKIQSGPAAISKVTYRAGNIVSAFGLFPVNKPSTQVETEYRGQVNVIRDCSPFEWLLLMDTPEKLIRMAPSDDVRQELLSTISTPGKVLQHVIEWVRDSMITTLPQGRDSIPPTFNEVEVILEARAASLYKNKRRRMNYHEPEPDWRRELETIHLPVFERYKRKYFNPLPSIPEESEFGIVVQGEESVTGESVIVNPNAKATKDDDAEVRCELWNGHLRKGLSQYIDPTTLDTALNKLREGFLNVWKRNVQRSYFEWERRLNAQGHEVLSKIRDAARDCIERTSNSSWWHWDQGSRPLFWRWVKDYQDVIRDGALPRFIGEMEPWTEPQRGPKNSAIRKSVAKKLTVIARKKYIERGEITSLMPFFNVPKGEKDVRMVYDGSASGLNANLWAPWFTLPSVDCLLRALEPEYSMADNDVGEMFHNFILHEDMRKHCGLDVTLYSVSPPEEPSWLRWNRLAMGLRTSPYQAVQGMLIAQEFILGNPADKNNIFHWERVRLNLPGDADYDPCKAWVSKIRKDGRVAADIFIYVDDVRSSAWDDDAAWAASQRTSSRLGYLGLQDAARKRREPSKETGAWTGSVVWTTDNQLSVMTTQDKWDKTRDHLAWIKANVGNEDGMNGKVLKSIRGFLVYVARTYPSMTPYLKGIHATIDSWRPGRDTDGWKLKKRKTPGADPPLPLEQYDDLDAVEIESAFGLMEECIGEPLLVYPVSRLHDDLDCLLELTEADAPPRRKVRMTSQARVIYGFGDASKQGFGASIELPDKNIFWRFGQWRLREEQVMLAAGKGMSFIEERSSNYRELRNLVETLEDAYRKGLLNNREIFMFTDNSTAESAFFRGTSSSKHLFDLVLRLRKIEMTGTCQIHMIHVAGTRMIWQGTDGLSRGDKNSGVMAGEVMTSFIPLHLSARDRSPACIEWISSWYCSGTPALQSFPLKCLTPNDWPTVLRERATYVWIPPPAAAEVAVHYMAITIHKRPTAVHLFLCPRLMTSRWQRALRKATDMFLFIQPGAIFWDSSQHEPLILAISLPLSRRQPWKHGGTPHCDHTRKVVQSMLQSDCTRAGSILCEFIERAWVLAEL